MQVSFGDVFAFSRGEVCQGIDVGLHGFFVLLCKPDLIPAQQGQIQKPGIMGGEDKLCVVGVDSNILYHLNQMPGQKWMHTGLNLIHNQHCAGFQSGQPHPDAEKETLCAD